MKQEDNNMITTWLKNNGDPQIEIKVLNETIDKLIEQLQMAYLQTDESAIEFASWCIKKRIDFFDSTEIGETYTIDGNVSKYKMNELLEIYKKESNL